MFGSDFYYGDDGFVFKVFDLGIGMGFSRLTTGDEFCTVCCVVLSPPTPGAAVSSRTVSSFDSNARY